MGTTLGEILHEHAGGMRDGLHVPRVLPGGASTDFLLADHLDVADGFRLRCRRPGAAWDRHDDGPRRQDLPGRDGLRTSRSSSPGSPAAGARRAGTAWRGPRKFLHALGTGPRNPEDSTGWSGTPASSAPGGPTARSLPGAMEPLQSALRYFRDDFDRHVEEHRCPWRCHGDHLHRRPTDETNPEGRTSSRAASPSATICRTSAGTRRSDRSAPAASARSRVYRDESDTRQDRHGLHDPRGQRTRISIRDPEAAELRRQVIDWLMLNHPHDCPVCDEGGECQLQDMTVMAGHDSRRYRFEKRTFRNQNLGPLVHHEMNRCIQCYRCVRYYRDYAGGTDLERRSAPTTTSASAATKMAMLENEFSGNLVEICPTGVFTDKTLKRHYARKWDLPIAPSVCVHCALGLQHHAGERYGTLRRIVNRYNHEVNG